MSHSDTQYMRQIDDEPFLASSISLKSTAVATLSLKGRLACLCFACLRTPAQIFFIFGACLGFLFGVYTIFKFPQLSYYELKLDEMQKPVIYACTTYLPEKHVKKPYVQSCGIMGMIYGQGTHDCLPFVREVSIKALPIEDDYVYPIPPDSERICYLVDYLPDKETVTQKDSSISITMVQEIKKSAVKNFFDADGDLQNFEQAVELTLYPSPVHYLVVHPNNNVKDRAAENAWIYSGGMGAYHTNIEATHEQRTGKDIIPFLPIGIPVFWLTDYSYRTTIYSTPFGMLSFSAVCFKNDPIIKECGAASVMVISFGPMITEVAIQQSQFFLTPLFNAGGLYSLGMMLVVVLLGPLSLLCTTCRKDYQMYLKRKKELEVSKRVANDIELKRQERTRSASMMNPTMRDIKEQYGFSTRLEGEVDELEGRGVEQKVEVEMQSESIEAEQDDMMDIFE